MQPNSDKSNPPDVKPNRIADAMKGVVLVSTGLAAVMWLAAFIALFCLIHYWDVEFHRKMEMIERGEVKPETLQITRVVKNDGGGWNVGLTAKGKKDTAWRTDVALDNPHVGDTMPGYRFDDKYLIPQLGDGNFWGKWIFLAVGMLPLVVIGIVLLVMALRKSTKPSEEQSYAGVSAAKAFSRPSMCFDGIPEDSQLVCLLGDSDCGPIKAVEEAGVLTVRPWLFPMKVITAWMILVAIAITCMMCFGTSLLEHRREDFLSPIFWAMLLLLWVLALPGFLGVLALINRSFAKKGDYFKVDLARHTLELCRVSRTIKASEIIAITLLTRWYCNAGGVWQKTHQTGVLVRTEDNATQLYPVVRELGENVPSPRRSKWADRLANVFQVPIRQVEVSRPESRVLNDC